MMTRILDNLKEHLGDHLQLTLDEFASMDIAVGYFNLRGWRFFDQRVAAKPKPSDRPTARVLIGMAVGGAHQEALDELQAAIDGVEVADADGEAAQLRRSQLLHELRSQLMRGIPTAQDRATLAGLRACLESGTVEAKVFTRRPLHGKTYVFHRDDLATPIVGFVGSSNLTAPGLMHNLELNVDVVDNVAGTALAEWFEDRWNDKFSRPITTELLDLLDASWAAPTPRPPYEVFLKLCYDMSRDVREGLAEYSVPSEISAQLLDFQTTAVRTLARRVMSRKGAMLGDVVGLGKTLTAIAVALMLRDEHGFVPLVVCPLNLVKMWEEHFEAYDLRGVVVPYSQAHSKLEALRGRHRFVIVDESHTLRNNQRRDYRAVRSYIDANDSRVLLLTATPFNLRFEDVANQLALYVDENEDLGISPSAALKADPRIADRVDSRITTLPAFRHSEFAEDWKRLMSEHLVRRTRSFIRDNYAHFDENGNAYLMFEDGRRFTFPTRIATPLSHSFGPDDPAARMAAVTTLDDLRGLLLPRYQLGRYVDPKATLTPDDRDFIAAVAAGRGQVAGFVRTTFYKRLSSCGHSFILSLRRHIARNELFSYALSSGAPIPTGDIVDRNLIDEDEDVNAVDLAFAEHLGDDAARRYELLRKANPRGVRWVRSDLFTTRLADDLAADTQVLRDLLDGFGIWSPDNDSKLQALIHLVQQTHPEDKILVFTEYRDTAEYVGRSLTDAGIDTVGVATGETGDPTALVQRFSPVSSALPGQDPTPIDDELRVLVATDVLSEGQNLQDAHIVVNYDLPWAIIRLIQRAGRVDRIGQLSDEVRIYSFFHESVDNVITLRQRIAARLKANAEAFGSDERFFGGPDETQVITDLYHGTLDEQADSDDVDASSLAYQFWHAAEQTHPELAQRVAGLPDLIDATRQRRPSEADSGVVCYVRTESGIDGFGLADDEGNLRLLTGHETLRLFEATPNEPAQALRSDHDAKTTELVRGPLSAPPSNSGRLRGVRRNIWNRLGNSLATVDEDVAAALDALYQHPLTTSSERRVRQAFRAGISDDELAQRLAILHRDNALVVESRTGQDPVRIVTTMGIVP